LKPGYVFFFNTILMMPDCPSASYFDEGLVTTSIRSTAFAGNDCRNWVTSLPASADSRPLIRIRTLLDPRRLTVPSISTCNDGTLDKRSVAVPPTLNVL